ncbi:hypothetical protein [Brevibacillus daliensis]|uniref:hypothetical protein n=1 Tax=Brevibacillus daliensis TaxID=2892995 RepID=UPI001E535F27|nr:hypothetical protein [Brevibacillus daliensis]
MEKTLHVDGHELHFATTCDGDSQYHVEVHHLNKLLSAFAVSAASESEVFPKAIAHVEADLDIGNITLS